MSEVSVCFNRGTKREQVFFALSMTLKTSILLLSHCRLLCGIPVTDENQKSISIPPEPSRLPPETAQRLRWRFHKPHLELLGQEVRTFFHISVLHLTGSQTFWFNTCKNY